MAVTVGDDPAEHSRLARALNGGRNGFNDDEPAVVDAFCDLVLQKALALVGRERVISMADEVAKRTAPRHEFSQSDVRQAILASLDGTAPPPLTRGQIFQLRHLLANFAILKMTVQAAAVEDLVTQAEDQAFANGFVPPLAE